MDRRAAGCGLAALAGAIAASLPVLLDDNVRGPLAAGTVLALWTHITPGLLEGAAPLLDRLPGCLVAVGILAGLAYAARLVDGRGVAAGSLLAALTWVFAGPSGFVLFAAFFVLGSGTTRLGRSAKARLGVEQADAGRRSWSHALANTGVAAFLAVLSAVVDRPDLLRLAMAGAFAAAAFDTVASEIGQAFGGRPLLVTTFRRVPVGTDGGVSVVGTLAGLAAAVVIAVLGRRFTCTQCGTARTAVRGSRDAIPRGRSCLLHPRANHEERTAKDEHELQPGGGRA